jgi:hypothetical protein
MALINAFVMLDDLPVTVMVAGSWQSGTRFIRTLLVGYAS